MLIQRKRYDTWMLRCTCYSSSFVVFSSHVHMLFCVIEYMNEYFLYYKMISLFFTFWLTTLILCNVSRYLYFGYIYWWFSIFVVKIDSTQLDMKTHFYVIKGFFLFFKQNRYVMKGLIFSLFNFVCNLDRNIRRHFYYFLMRSSYQIIKRNLPFPFLF